MIDVLIVDDHAVMRELLGQVLKSYADILVAAEVANGEDAVKQVTLFQPAIALVDVHLPTMSGIETSKLIRINSPRTVVIGLTAGEPDQEDMGMIAAGASAVLNKADVVERLYPTIVKSLKSYQFSELSVPLS
jgi:two-component system, NarL family, invasion response regulator UvrY